MYFYITLLALVCVYAFVVYFRRLACRQREKAAQIGRAKVIVAFSKVLKGARKELKKSVSATKAYAIVQQVSSHSLNMFEAIGNIPLTYSHGGSRITGYCVPVRQIRSGIKYLVADISGALVVVGPGVHPLIIGKPWGAGEILTAFESLIAPRLKESKMLLSEANLLDEAMAFPEIVPPTY